MLFSHNCICIQLINIIRYYSHYILLVLELPPTLEIIERLIRFKRTFAEDIRLIEAIALKFLTIYF